jgi:hypothetical protein
MATNGVPDVIVSAWVGHADLSVAKRTCVHHNHPAMAPVQVIFRALAHRENLCRAVGNQAGE